MTSKPRNLFPDTLHNIIAADVSSDAPQLVMVKMFQAPSAKNNSSAAPSPETVLHPHELVTFGSYKLAKRKNEFLTGRYCVKEAINNYFLKIQRKTAMPGMHEIEIHGGPGGRPAARIPSHAGATPPEISIAHSGAYGVAVAAENICGVDLQQEAATLLRVQQRYSTAGELQVMEEVLPQETLLTRLTLLWATKEAAKKALSFWRMPGFLELHLTDGRQNSSDSLQLRVKNISPKDSSAPLEFTVFVSRYLDYGLAVCCVDKESSNA